MSATSVLPRGSLPLLLICTVHGAALGALALGLGQTVPPKPPEVVMAVVVPPQPMPVVAPPTETPPEVKPTPRPPVQQPKPAPLPPIKDAPPSPHAINTPVAEPTPPVPEVAKAEPAPPAPPAPPVVTPPRSDAAHLNNPAPAYPTLSRKLGEQGKVLLSIYVLADGTVGELKVKQSSGFSRLDDAALSAVKRWKFVPARQGDTPVAYWYVQPLNFALNAA